MGYFAATGKITGGVAIQNLLSLENPVASGRKIIVGRATVGGVLGAASATKFLYRLGRTVGVPTVGTVLAIQRRNTFDIAPIGIARQAPTAVAAAGDMWVASPGVILPAALLGTAIPALATSPYEAFNPNLENQIILLEGEAVLFRAEVNTADWTHWATFEWDEVR